MSQDDGGATVRGGDEPAFELDTVAGGKGDFAALNKRGPMSRVAIVTDSAANLPPELAVRYGIQVVPFNLYWDGRMYRDGIDLSPGELYKRLRGNPDKLPSSSSPSVGDFLQLFTG